MRKNKNKFVLFSFVILLLTVCIFVCIKYATLKQSPYSNNSARNDLNCALYYMEIDQNYNQLSDEEILVRIASYKAYCNMAIQIVGNSPEIIVKSQEFINDMERIEQYLSEIIEDLTMLQKEEVRNNLSDINEVLLQIALTNPTDDVEEKYVDLLSDITQKLPDAK